MGALRRVLTEVANHRRSEGSLIRHWIITVHHISNVGLPSGPEYARGATPPKDRGGYKRAPREWIERYRAAAGTDKAFMLSLFKADMTDEFRLFDDDGESPTTTTANTQA